MIQSGQEVCHHDHAATGRRPAGCGPPDACGGAAAAACGADGRGASGVPRGLGIPTSRDWLTPYRDRRLAQGHGTPETPRLAAYARRCMLGIDPRRCTPRLARTEIGGVRTEIGALRKEMDAKFQHVNVPLRRGELSHRPAHVCRHRRRVCHRSPEGTLGAVDQAYFLRRLTRLFTDVSERITPRPSRAWGTSSSYRRKSYDDIHRAWEGAAPPPPFALSPVEGVFWSLSTRLQETARPGRLYGRAWRLSSLYNTPMAFWALHLALRRWLVLHRAYR